MSATRVADKALSRFDMREWDLVVDSTASSSVAHCIEEELKATSLRIPMLTMSVSAAAENGSVIVKMPGFSGGSHRIARQAKIEAFKKNADHVLVKAFWPERESIMIFQPEPGCSAPTFIGSAADIDHHASGLLNIGLFRIKNLAFEAASMDLVAAPWLQMAEMSQQQLQFTFKSYVQHAEQEHGYTVLRSDSAAREMETELRRITRTRSNKVETGGLIFGEVDDAHQLIWIDGLSGPPPDSTANEAQFLCGTAGTKELNLFKSSASGKSSRFVGIWHTHPISRGKPSTDDLVAMAQLLHLQEFPPRQVVMLIVVFSASKKEENYYLFRRDQFSVKIEGKDATT